MPKITKRTVDALKPHERERVVWDDDLKGFGVRVHPSGRKVFIVKTRYRGRIIKMTIGPHGAVSPTYARVRAAEIITDARAGKNPAGRKSGAPTMRALGKRFLEDYVPVHCKPSTAEEYRRSIKLFIDPKIGKLRVAGRSAERHRGPPSRDARDALSGQPDASGCWSKIFNLAELWELRPDGSNPCRHVKRFKEKKRERFLSDEEYRRLGATLRDIEADSSETAAVIAAIRLLMLTGCRLSEIQKLRWEHVDLNAGELRLPDTKTGAKVVHLGDPAIAVLRGIQIQDDNPWVITGRKPGSHLTDLQHPWRRIRAQRGARRCANPRFATQLCQRRTARRRRLAHDRQTPRSHTGSDHRPLRPSRQRSRQVRRQPHRQQDR